MQFGHFDDETREYVIETPRTPYPWINYLGTEEFFSLISHTAGGYCFYRDARFRRLTRYRYNNVPTDIGGRYFYIRDGEDVWTPTWMPMKAELENFECRHGLGLPPGSPATRNGSAAETLHLVPLGETAEVHQLNLTNGSRQKKNAQALLLCRVLSVERVGRPDQLPAQLLHRRGRGGRQPIYPQDRVPGAPQPFRLLWRQRSGRRLRHRPRDLPRALQRLARARRRCWTGPRRNSMASGWAPIGSHSSRSRPRSRREADVRFRPRLRRESP